MLIERNNKRRQNGEQYSTYADWQPGHEMTVEEKRREVHSLTIFDKQASRAAEEEERKRRKGKGRAGA